jgi:hypothetical protein
VAGAADTREIIDATRIRAKKKWTTLLFIGKTP